MGFLQNAGQFCRGQLRLFCTHQVDPERELYRMPICMRFIVVQFYRGAWALESSLISTKLGG